MKRRVFLTTTLGAILSGCMTTDNRSTLPKSVAITDQDTVPDRINLEISVSVRNGEITEDNPAMIEVTITNTGTESRTVYPGSMPVFGEPVSTADEGNQVILRQDTASLDESDKVAPDCWQWNHDRVGTGAAPWRTSLRPGEEVSERFIVYGHPDNVDPCLPVGKYRFEDRYRVEGSGGFEEEFGWGFGVEITGK